MISSDDDEDDIYIKFAFDWVDLNVHHKDICNPSLIPVGSVLESIRSNRLPVRVVGYSGIPFLNQGLLVGARKRAR